MAKCMFCKKSHLKGYRQCEITGQIKKHICLEHFCHCKDFKLGLYDRFIEWYNKVLGY